MHANKICDEYGIDVISAGVCIGFLRECPDKGLIEPKDGPLTGFGHPLNPNDLFEILESIAYRKGIGNLLADGVARMAEKLGGQAKEFAMHVKGLELGGYDPRGSKDEGLAFAINTRGGCHHSVGYVVGGEITSECDKFATRSKPKLVQEYKDLEVLCDSLIVYTFSFLRLEEMPFLLHSAIGLNVTKSELNKIATRIFNTE